MRTLNKIILFAFALPIAGQTTAFSKSVEFSADAVINVPQQPAKHTKLYVSKQAVRREIDINGNKVVEIVFPKKGKAVLINHQLRSYQERTFPAQNDEKSISPCNQIRNSECEKIGKETIDGINTEKWQIISHEQGKRTRTLHWIDAKRKLAIREFFPDGTVSELKMVKKEQINKRKTEKWKRTLSRPNGQDIVSYQWYDSKLKIAIREELPGGYSRELRNIKLSKQPGELFKVPDGYMYINNASTSR